ncbi:MAG: peptidoglycan DD-metalloendopeptidase family protein, partial [Bacilli bacterium]|nr:peptidoglycan DD-metalloendopeptidase family protein [Bacilli bacterium]
NREPKEVYNIYLDGNKIGTVKSKVAFEEYINSKEETLKDKYKVDKIYTPKGVEIKKVVTYNDKCDSNEDIYKVLVNKQNFTLKGVIIEITPKKEETKEEQEDEKKEEKEVKKTIINVTSRDIFDAAVVNLVKAFIDEKEYNAFMEGTQAPIVDTGTLVESIYLKEDVTYREGYIPTDEEIFTDTDELTKYLLYGTTEKQNTYVVKEGDTIESIANKNKLNTKEFLIANPEFTSVNNLLYESQVVNVGLINPVISVIVEKHSVAEEVSKYSTEIKYDNELVIGYNYVEREGENGLDKVTRKYQYINGQVADVALISSVEIKPSVSQILVKGEKYIPNVADLSYWAWPTQRPYTITTWFEYRWGSFHNAIDIYVGWGSPVYAGNNGTVVAAFGGCVRGDTRCNGGRGNYIIIDHGIKGYHTEYMHLAYISVRTGQTVQRGQYIAAMGNTGYVVPTPGWGSSSNAGTHLHYGLWIGHPDRGGTAINPMGVY